MSDILDVIDAAIGCQQCGRQLGGSPSDDFCSEGCQRAWHAAHTEPLVNRPEYEDGRPQRARLLVIEPPCPRCGERDWRGEVDEITGPDYREEHDSD